MAKPLPDHGPLLMREHISLGKSLRRIEREFGLANGTLSKWAIVKNFPVRSKSEQAKADIASGTRDILSGESHWAWGMTKETSDVHARHSERMTNHNPSRMEGVSQRIASTNRERGTYARASARLRGTTVSIETREKISKTVAPQLLKRMSGREQVMFGALVKCGGAWIPQYQTCASVLDFARPDIKVAFEPHCGGAKVQRSEERDSRLVSHGWTIIRFRTDRLTSEEHFALALKFAEEFVPDFKCPYEIPSGRRHYGVVVRCPENIAGLRTDNPNDPAFIELAAHIKNRLQSAGVSDDNIANDD